jgi:site-specific DNA-cytosine methylase
MLLLELFSGTKSVGTVASQLGYDVISLDIAKKFKPTYCMDILDVDDVWLDQLVEEHGRPDVIWASPDCRHYSKIRRNWRSLGHRPPDLEYADSLVQKALYIIEYLQPKHALCENPYSGLLKSRHFMKGIPCAKCCYCKYDPAFSKKETMIWCIKGSLDAWVPKMCAISGGHTQCEKKRSTGKHAISLGNSLHVQVRRVDRLRIPPALIRELFEAFANGGS